MAQHTDTLVVSPHYDDAVLSCGDLLAATPGSTVLTVYSGVPPADTPLTDWDRRCGFTHAGQAMLAREREDSLALAGLDAQALRLGLLDCQYGVPAGVSYVRSMLAAILAQLRPARVYLPLGLFHEDHVRVSDAMLELGASAPPGQAWYVYEEALYRCKPGVVQRRLAELLAREVGLTPEPGPHPPGPAKAQAVRAYASQLHALGLEFAMGDPARPERYWTLQWEAAAARMPASAGAAA